MKPAVSVLVIAAMLLASCGHSSEDVVTAEAVTAENIADDMVDSEYSLVNLAGLNGLFDLEKGLDNISSGFSASNQVESASSKIPSSTADSTESASARNNSSIQESSGLTTGQAIGIAVVVGGAICWFTGCLSQKSSGHSTNPDDGARADAPPQEPSQPVPYSHDDDVYRGRESGSNF